VSAAVGPPPLELELLELEPLEPLEPELLELELLELELEDDPPISPPQAASDSRAPQIKTCFIIFPLSTWLSYYFCDHKASHLYTFPCCPDRGRSANRCSIHRFWSHSLKKCELVLCGRHCDADPCVVGLIKESDQNGRSVLAMSGQLLTLIR
jgi:hypothetical protein